MAISPQLSIPFSKPAFAENTSHYITEVLESGAVKGGGIFAGRCETLLESALACRRVLLTTSCTTALDMCALLLDIQPGDEVILPSFTFPSTANAFVLRGAVPRFADIQLDTLNLDMQHVASLVTPKTRAVVAVHYNGVACDIEDLTAILDKHGLAFVEDNAHGPFCAYKGRSLGTFGQLAALSFHETKNYTSGEGGALLVNDPGLIDRAIIMRDKGTNREQFRRGEVPFYHWVDAGSNYAPSEFSAAVLLAQLETAAGVQGTRKRIWTLYRNGLRDWAEQHNVLLQTVPAHCEPSHHVFYLLLPSHTVRNDLMSHLARHGVESTFHYSPLHAAPMGERFGARCGDLPVTERVNDCILRLPLHNGLSVEDQEYVIETVLTFQPALP